MEKKPVRAITIVAQICELLLCVRHDPNEMTCEFLALCSYFYNIGMLHFGLTGISVGRMDLRHLHCRRESKLTKRPNRIMCGLNSFSPIVNWIFFSL